uniref:ubiquitinyl hydrolase 1 n=1 Tax=Meloidogyne enterolobii TaxID=390850 RepID=A0A6V7X841_MELEN|nr:unnamed protein product [Meloidogyne enterolobii]
MSTSNKDKYVNYEDIYKNIVEDIAKYGMCGIDMTKWKVGFENIGNSCFCNSVLQCLMHTTKFIELYSGGGIKSKINKEAKNTKGCLTAWLCAISNCYWSGTYSQITTVEIMNTIAQLLGEKYNGQLPESAFKFQELLLSQLSDDVNEVSYPAGFVEHRDNIYLIYDNDIGKIFNDYETKIRSNISSCIYNIFRNVQIRIFSCSCTATKITFQEKLSIDMDITWDESNTDLQSCLTRHFQNYTSNEMCPRCPNREIPVTFYIWKLPQILVIHLGRFFDGKKNNRFIEFPLEELDMTNYLHPNSSDNELDKSNLIYSLYAIMEHYTIPVEHFTAKIKNKETKEWLWCNDKIVTNLNSSDIKTNAAYILYYKRKDMTDLK